jgi:hypothetical protein
MTSLGNATFILAQRLFEIQPKAIPTSLFQEVAVDCELFEIEMTNDAGQASTVFVRDGAGRTCIPQTVLNDKAVLTYEAKRGRFMSGGIFWSSSVAGVVGRISGYRP